MFLVDNLIKRKDKLKKIFVIVFLGCLMYGQSVDCVGSSITRNGYPGYVSNLMQSNGYAWRAYNYGVPGAGVIINAYKNTVEYAEVICREAEVVVLLLGANDWKWYSTADQGGTDRWRSEYEKLVTEFKKSSIVVLGYLIHRVSVNGGDVTLANATMDRMNIVIASIAGKYGLLIIDFKTAIGTNPDHFWVSDGLHPSYTGSELMGAEAYNYLKTLVSTQQGINNCQDPVTQVEVMNFNWVQIEDRIRFTWNSVDEVTHYRLLKTHKVDDVWDYWWDDTITTTEYLDGGFIYDWDYFCYVEAYKHGELIGKSPVKTVRYYQYLLIDDEYWEAVKDYEEQRKIGWFGCSAK